MVGHFPTVLPSACCYIESNRLFIFQSCCFSDTRSLVNVTHLYIRKKKEKRVCLLFLGFAMLDTNLPLGIDNVALVYF